MTTTSISEAVHDLDAEIAEAEARLAALRQERTAAERFLRRLGVTASDSLQTRPPAHSNTQPVSGTSNTELVYDLLKQNPDGISLTELRRLLQEVGHEIDGDQVRSSVTYLRRKRQAEPLTRGTWRLVPAPTNAEGPATTGPSAVPNPAATTQEGGGASGTGTHRVRDDSPVRQTDHLAHAFGAPIEGA